MATRAAAEPITKLLRHGLWWLCYAGKPSSKGCGVLPQVGIEIASPRWNRYLQSF